MLPARLLLILLPLSTTAWGQTAAEIDAMESDARSLKESVDQTQKALQQLRERVAQTHTLPSQVRFRFVNELKDYAFLSLQIYVDGERVEPADEPGSGKLSLKAGSHTLQAKARLRSTSGAAGYLRSYPFNLQASHTLDLKADTRVEVVITGRIEGDAPNSRPSFVFATE